MPDPSDIQGLFSLAFGKKSASNKIACEDKRIRGVGLRYEPLVNRQHAVNVSSRKHAHQNGPALSPAETPCFC